jgi:uncharacterized protein (DUF1684 family)
MRRINLVVAALAVVCAVSPAHGSDFQQEALKWRAERHASLTSEDGWLSLIGLHWLNDGANTIGSGRDNNVVLRANVPARLGTVVLRNGVVTLKPAPSSGLKIGGRTVIEPTPLVDDTDPKGPTTVESGTVRFYVIKRNDKFALRVKDPESKARKHFLGLTYFPADEKWRVVARFEPFQPPRHVPIANVLGMTTDEVAPGLLVFTVAGKEYRLEPILEQGEKDYFIIFKDRTSGKETYGAARYLYAHPPGPDGKTVIDFNRAYNPPCAFTPYATCPLPPAQNRLPFRIEAGEKKYAGGH